jgi:hypothetical protein
LIIGKNGIPGFRRQPEKSGPGKYVRLAPEVSRQIKVLAGRIVFYRTAKRDHFVRIPVVDKPVPPGGLHELVSLKTIHG